MYHRKKINALNNAAPAAPRRAAPRRVGPAVPDDHEGRLTFDGQSDRTADARRNAIVGHTDVHVVTVSRDVVYGEHLALDERPCVEQTGKDHKNTVITRATLVSDV